MNKLTFFLIALLGISSFATGADIKYPVSDIPESLKKDMNAVVREDRLTFRIVNQHNAIQSAHLVTTILNAGGNHHARWGAGYDKLIRFVNLRAAVYDASGKVIRKVKSSEFVDQSSFSGLYSDDRSKSIDLTQGTFPYTVEIEYELEYKFLFYMPTDYMISDEKTSLQEGQFTLVYADGLKPRYRTLNVDQAPKESKVSDGANQIQWTFTNLMPPTKEPYGPEFRTKVPTIASAPSKFEFDNYVGTMDTWQSYGKWIALLNSDRKNLPEETKAKAREIVSKYNSREDKIRALYEYLQGKTRYVSIQLGIGGFQPFDAGVVDKTGYGDCKALSNYMVTLLDAAGIKANYVLIRAGRDVPPMIPDFPSSQFNHVVVAVPNGTDTLWLECTSQTNPFGFAGGFTGDRKALMITDEGAKVVNTTRYPEDVNVQSTHATITVDPNGNATANVITRYAGLQYENGGLSQILESTHDDKKKWVQRNTDIPSFDVKNFTMTDHKDRIPYADVQLDLVLNRYASVSGKRLFLTPNLMNRRTNVPEKIADRKSKVVVRLAYTDIDTIQYNIPESIYPEFLPEPVKHKSRFGEYEASVTLDAGKLIYVRKMVMHRGEFPAESYTELVEFIRNVSRTDNAKIVFLNKT